MRRRRLGVTDWSRVGGDLVPLLGVRSGRLGSLLNRLLPVTRRRLPQRRRGRPLLFDGAQRRARRARQAGVLLDAVLGLDDVAVAGGVAALRAPGEEVAADLDIVVRELAVLVVVHAEKLSLLRSTQLQTGDNVDNLGDDGGHDKGVGGGGDNGSNLPADDLVVAVEEAAEGARVDAVEADNLLAGEEGVEEEADHAADAVLGEDIEGVVNADEELDCGKRLAMGTW